MKKIRLIVAVVTLALMVMGIGYAAWSQTIPMSVGGTLGKFDVVVSNAYAVNANGAYVRDADYAYADFTPSTSKEVVLTANKLIPGAYRDYVVTFKNVGDAPAVLTSIEFKQSINGDVLKEIVTTVDGKSVRLDTKRTIDLSKSMNPGDTVTINIRVQLDHDATNSIEETPFKFTMTPLFEQP